MVIFGSRPERDYQSDQRVRFRTDEQVSEGVVRLRGRKRTAVPVLYGLTRAEGLRFGTVYDRFVAYRQMQPGGAVAAVGAEGAESVVA